MNQATHTTWLALYHLFLRDSWRMRPVRPPQVALSCRFGSFLPSSFGCSQVVGGSMGNHGRLGVKDDAKSNYMELIIGVPSLTNQDFMECNKQGFEDYRWEAFKVPKYSGLYRPFYLNSKLFKNMFVLCHCLIAIVFLKFPLKTCW